MNNKITDFLNKFKEVTEYYENLVEKTKEHEYVGITNEWLIDNYYLLVEHKINIVNDKKNLLKKLKKSDKIFYTVYNIAAKNNYNINFKILTTELNNYQKEHNEYFSYKEIEIIPTLLSMIYMDKIIEICEIEATRLKEKNEVTEIIKKNKDNRLRIEDFIEEGFDIDIKPNYVFEINNQLKELGTQANSVFKNLNKILEEKKINIKDVLNNEYQKRIETNVLISNIFNDLKEFFEFDQEDLYEKISKCEKCLMQDSTYNKMTIETKTLYRKQILKLAKKEKITENTYIDKLIKQAERQDKHIGELLFKRKSNKLNAIVYISSIIILSVLLTLFLSQYFIDFQVLGFIILLIPVMQLVIQILNQILTSIVKPKPLPKMDFTKGIPKEDATMVVIPTIVATTEKVKEMFDTLETYYLVNKTNNLYFTLLGDVKAYDKEVYPLDEQISKFGVEYANKLNHKYKKNIFQFVYRRRIWNEKENCYLGYERKRGALLQFNKLLLKQMSLKDQVKNYNVHTFDDFDVDIKYVITLDTDTKLVLNTALNLVGAMSHPLNKPILNKNRTRVIKGYALMQPRVSVDIEATNKSLYSQIFAGIGGFDTYGAIVPNIQQDLFNEGSFVGKGIYDLRTFDELLYKKFPDNLILSHDLLEGNYLRCGYVSDIELIDDFPSKFLTDITRHHRWARGDAQIIEWVSSKVRNYDGNRIKNPISVLGKWKTLDNILRMFLYPSMLLIILLSLTISKNPIIWLLFIILEIALPIIFFLKSKIYSKKEDKKTIYYNDLMFGGKSLILRSIIVFASIPYYSKLYMDAFFRSIYRMTISKKNLLNWITAEEVEKTVKSDLKSYIKNFTFNLIIAGLLIIYGIIKLNIIPLVIALFFIIAPFILHRVSKDIDHNKMELNQEEQNDVTELAYSTWKFFEDNLRPEFNYLIPDNYQENRELKLDRRTSPTNIGFSLTSIISAYNLEFITRKTAVRLISNVIKTVESLEKWNGHLYNWYNIETREVMYPYFVSTVDSGNFVASLIVVEQFLIEEDEIDLAQKVNKLIAHTNFKKLYSDKDVFSIGYDGTDAKLSIYNYNKFASESRLTSYLAIAKGDVPSKHWFCLDKSLTTHNRYKGLISWSGTSFEYYMPFIFMKNYSNTLLDESYKFAHYCQKEFIESVDKKLPWGISESAYAELDNSQNYKYKTFATPYLKAKEDKENRIVISPYASLMAMELFPTDVYENVIKLKNLDMYGEYGFYESYDYDNKGIVKAYFSHHQGMILASLANYLKHGIIQNYFHKDVSIRTFDILMKEKVQVKTSIDMKMAKYKKYNYEKEQIENDIRTYNYISDMPEVSVLSNKKYSVLMNDRGSSFSRYRTLQLNRYRKITEQDYGIFMYIKDLNTDKVWSNTYAPMNVKPEKYEVIFASDKIKYIRKDKDITTKTEVIVTANHHAEIRKITFTNESSEQKILELTTYTEPILSENTDDVSHRVFNNMFLKSEYDNETNSLIMIRKTRNDSNINSYMINRLVIDNPVEEYQYETDRLNFIGRNNTTMNPDALNKELSNQVGTNLEPVMSLRNVIVVEPNKETSVYLINGFGRSREQLMDIINSYNDEKSIKTAFEVANLSSVINTKNLNITGEDMRLFNIMLNYLYQTTKISVTDERNELLKKNALAQNGLWKFGVSGDRPIVLINIHDISDINFVREILKAFEYYKNISIFVDIIIINSENEEYAGIIKKEVEDEKYRIYTLNNFSHTPGSITLIDQNDINEEEMSLLNIVPRLKFDTNNNKSLKENIEDLQKNNKITMFTVAKPETNIEMKQDIKELKYYNNYGGFINNGKEYKIINKNTPTPWTNVIANKNFGTVITNNGCGFTYCYNSGEYKITSWTNDTVLNDKSEGIKINGKVFDPSECIHGFGYSILSSESEDLEKQLTEFVALEDNVKIFMFKVKNKLKKAQKINFDFWINPTFGNFEEKTSRHILAEYINNDNYLKLRNVYSINFSNITVFMSSSEKLTGATTNKILVKSVDTKIELDSNEEKTIIFTMGCSDNEKENLELIKKYNNVNNATKELNKVKEYWNKTLNTIEVETPDDSLNYVLNGWYLYQTLSSRIMAKAGFYQVSGAFGYRDQLQDSMNISYIKPDFTREQIIRNAKHQFVEGDVLHWWHEGNRFGLRSRYKDDYLWLPYATIEYINATNDTSILKEQIPFVTGDLLKEEEHEKGLVFGYTEETKSLLEHCILSIQLSMNSLGKHKIPLMGGGDWNDGMNKVGIKGKGESVWLGFFLYDVIDKFINLVKDKNIKVKTKEYIEFNNKLKESLNKNTWDGEYYLRAFFDNGNKLGSHENDECKIDLISQSFSILSGVIEEDRIESVIDSVEKKLVDKDNNIIKLLTPAFSKSSDNPGYIMNYPKGIRENGGQYTHATSWYIMALIKAGKIDKAYEYYQMINPINRTSNKKDTDKYKTEPYVIAADIYSSTKYPGRGGWTWYTGSAGWYYKVGIKEILGFNKQGDKLIIKPNVPTTWKNFNIKYNYMDTTYNIEVIFGNKEELVVDKKVEKNNYISLINDTKKHNVKVYIKRV